MAYNYCFLTGRSKGYFRTSGLSRIKFKEYNSNGYLPGFRKSS